MTDVQREGFAELPEMNPGPVLRLDLNGTIQLANRAARALYDVDQLTGRSWRELCPGLSLEMWAKVLSSKNDVQCNADLRGRSFLFRFVHEPSSQHVFVYGSDVSDLKNAETRLAEQAERLTEMAQFPEMNPGPVCRLDTDGRILLANRATRDLFGHKDVRGVCWLDLCPGIDRVFFDQVLASPTALAFEARLAGREYLFTHTRAPSGREVFVYGADVTEQKAAERAILRTEKMATLGTLAAGVAHELNNPAAAAKRAADHLRDSFAKLQRAQLALEARPLLDSERQTLGKLNARALEKAGCTCTLEGVERNDREEQIEQWLDETGVPDTWDWAPQLVEFNFTIEELVEIVKTLQSEHVAPVLEWLVHVHSVFHLLEEIRHGAGRVSEIVGALKSYSFLGQAPIQEVDVNEGLRQTLIVLRSKLKQGVHVVQELATDLPLIHAYGSELNQVWTNLIDNAIGAMGGQGTLVLRSFRDGNYLVVVVRDDGPGIPSTIVSQVFDPFFTTKAPGQGTGLGLHTCYSIVTKRHGGSIDVDSQPGDTSFTVRLPIAQQTGNTPPQVLD